MTIETRDFSPWLLKSEDPAKVTYSIPDFVSRNKFNLQHLFQLLPCQRPTNNFNSCPKSKQLIRRSLVATAKSNQYVSVCHEDVTVCHGCVTLCHKRVTGVSRKRHGVSHMCHDVSRKCHELCHGVSPRRTPSRRSSCSASNGKCVGL